jgi:hypothetical protein
MTKQPLIEFFIDTYNKEAYQNILSIINTCNIDDVDEKYNVHVTRIHEDGEDCHYFYLKGSWDAYKCFMMPSSVNNQDPKYHYSLAHYEE